MLMVLLAAFALVVIWQVLQKKHTTAYYIIDSTIVPVALRGISGDCLLQLAKAHKLEVKVGTISLVIHEKWDRLKGLDSGSYRRITISLDDVRYDQEMQLPSTHVHISYSSGGISWLSMCQETTNPNTTGSIALHKSDDGMITADIFLEFDDKSTFSGVYKLMERNIESGNSFSNMLTKN